jgi:hypothetical protein
LLSQSGKYRQILDAFALNDRLNPFNIDHPYLPRKEVCFPYLRRPKKKIIGYFIYFQLVAISSQHDSGAVRI